jgi:hypothetical protein
VNKKTFVLPRAALACWALACAVSLPSMAGDDHDHGAEPAAAGDQASPRVEAHSDLFELVGIVEKGQMTVYLDRYATNEPVTNARIEFEAGPNKGMATARPDGVYVIKFDALSRPGELPFSFTVTAGSDTDLLAGELHMEDPHAHEEAAERPWLRWAGLAAVTLAALAAAVYLGRSFASRRARRTLA